jgi:hypothetical protein
MQASAALRQLDDTLRLAGDFSSTAARDLERLMDGGKKGLARNLGKMSQWRKVPDRYLAYLYGVAPLADDLSNAFEQLSLYNERGNGLNVVVRAGQKLTETTPSHVINLNSGSGGFQAGLLWGTRKIGVRCGYRFDIPDWYLQQGPILTPFSEAYELTKMSFVLDWFLPVGNWISSMESAQFSPFFKEGFEVIKVVDTYNSAKPNNSFNDTVAIDIKGRLVVGAMRRASIGTWAETFGLPTFNPTPSWSKAAQGLSLLTQTFKRWR